LKRHEVELAGSISILGLGSEQSMFLSSSIHHKDSTPKMSHSPLDKLSAEDDNDDKEIQMICSWQKDQPLSSSSLLGAYTLLKAV
jgi:hypothetical protein